MNLVPRSVRRHARLSLLLWGVLLAALPSQAQDGNFTSRGLQLHYRSIGTGTPVVILSGGPGFEVDYMRPVAELLPAYRRILLEQRGTGRSRPPKLNGPDMTLEVAVADLEALREHLEQSRLVLVGHSWGGILAMAYAAAHPDRIDRLVLIGSGGPTLEFVARFQDNIRARMRPEDIEAERYWAAAGKQGVPDVKVAYEATRAIVPRTSSIEPRGWRSLPQSRKAAFMSMSTRCCSLILRSSTTFVPACARWTARRSLSTAIRIRWGTRPPRTSTT